MTTETEIKKIETKLGKLLTVKDVKEMLNVNSATIYEYINSGKLAAHRLGGNGGKHRLNRKHWRIWEQDLLEFINSGRFILPKRKAGAE